MSKAFADGVTLICLRGKDVLTNGREFGNLLMYTELGLLLGHLLLLNQCFDQGKWVSLVINVCMTIYTFGVVVFLKRNREGLLKQIIKSMKGLKLNRPNILDKMEWLQKFAHPLIKQLPNFPFVIPEPKPRHKRTSEQLLLPDSRENKGKKAIDLKKILRRPLPSKEVPRSKSVYRLDLKESRAPVKEPLECLPSVEEESLADDVASNMSLRDADCGILDDEEIDRFIANDRIAKKKIKKTKDEDSMSSFFNSEHDSGKTLNPFHRRSSPNKYRAPNKKKKISSSQDTVSDPLNDASANVSREGSLNQKNQEEENIPL